MYYFKDIIIQKNVNNCVVLYNIKFIISPEYPDIKPTMLFKSDQINEYNHNIIQYNVDKYLSSYFLYNGVIYETIVFFEVFIIIIIQKQLDCLCTFNKNKENYNIGFRIYWLSLNHHYSSYKLISMWMKELELLGGLRKIYPTILYFEGSEENCCKLVERLKTIQWKFLVLIYINKVQRMNKLDIEKDRKVIKDVEEYNKEKVNNFTKVIKKLEHIILDNSLINQIRFIYFFLFIFLFFYINEYLFIFINYLGIFPSIILLFKIELWLVYSIWINCCICFIWIYKRLYKRI